VTDRRPVGGDAEPAKGRPEGRAVYSIHFEPRGKETSERGARNMRYLTAVAALALVLAVTGLAGATTVAFSSYDDASGDYNAWNNTSPSTEILEPFTTTNALEWSLSGVKLNAYGGGIFGGGSSPAAIALYEDQGGAAGTAISSWNVNIDSGVGEDFSFGVSGVTLSGNTDYWFGLEATGSNAVGWEQTLSYGTPGETGHVFSIEGEPAGGQPIPEPLTMAGLVLGIGSLARYFRRRRRV